MIAPQLSVVVPVYNEEAGLTALFAFLWSMRSGQYEDMQGAALRVLSDDDVQS